MFNITKKDNYTLKELDDFNRNQDSIVRSAHIGNFDKTTMFVAQQGFPIFLGEHLKGFSGEHYRPAFIRHNGVYKKLTKNNQELVMHANNLLLDSIPINIQQYLGVSQNCKLTPVHLHWISLRKLYCQIELQSALFLKQENFICDVIKVLGKYFPFAFNIYATKQGKELQLDSKRSDDKYFVYSNERDEVSILKSHVAENALNYLRNICVALKDRDVQFEGVIMHTRVIIMLYTLTEIFRDRAGVQRFNKNSMDVIHLAGLKMLFYLVDNLEQSTFYSDQSNQMYLKLIEYFPNELPGVINLQLVPTYTMEKFITTDVNVAEKMDQVIYFYLKNDLQQVKIAMKKLLDNHNLNDGNISQYDVIDKQLKLYLPEQANLLSQKKLEEISMFVLHPMCTLKGG